MVFLCQYELRGATCRGSVNDCDIPETCTGDSSQVKEVPQCICTCIEMLERLNGQIMFSLSLSLLQCPHNVHKLDGYMCDAGQVKLHCVLEVTGEALRNIY